MKPELWIMDPIVFGAIVAALVTFILSTIQLVIGLKAGSDHPAHFFLTNAIRANGHRLFGRIPGLLNTCYCGAIPLYLHWILSHFGTQAMYWSERLLNPTINAVHAVIFTIVVWLAAQTGNMPALYVSLAALAFALTPQFYHALSARNFGLSARGTGLLLLTLFFVAAYYVEDGEPQPLWWAALVLTSWLIWGFSTFSQQALILISIILFFTTGRYAPICGSVLGLVFFIIIHREYSLSYLKYTYKFLCTYAEELAPIYIINKRQSIWRDLIWDIWTNIRNGLLKGGVYAYGNSLLVVLFFNPFIALGSWLALTDRIPTGLVSYAASLTLAGAVATLLTSFKHTRFLGEPERYAEAVTPWAVLCGTYFVYSSCGYGALMAVVVACAAANMMQLYASLILMRHVKTTGTELDDIAGVIVRQLGNDVRFCSNNEQLTKLLMKNKWRFAFFWVVGQDYCGMTVKEAFTTFPSLKREACERIVSTYKINACVLDRTLYDTLFDIPPPGLCGMSVAYESEGLRLLLLQWETLTASQRGERPKESSE